MAFERKNNSGSLFKNEDKTQDTHADYRGEAKVEGVDFWINAWINTSKNGKRYMSITFKLKEAKAAKPALKVVGGSESSDPNDEIPF